MARQRPTTTAGYRVHLRGERVRDVRAWTAIVLTPSCRRPRIGRPGGRGHWRAAVSPRCRAGGPRGYLVAEAETLCRSVARQLTRGDDAPEPPPAHAGLMLLVDALRWRGRGTRIELSRRRPALAHRGDRHHFGDQPIARLSATPLLSMIILRQAGTAGYDRMLNPSEPSCRRAPGRPRPGRS